MSFDDDCDIFRYVGIYIPGTDEAIGIMLKHQAERLMNDLPEDKKRFYETRRMTIGE